MRGAMNACGRPYRFGRPLRFGLLSLLSLAAGAILVAVGLELFLKPNRLVPGGAQGISVLLSHMTEMRLGLFLFVVNVPFVFAGGAGKARGSAVVRLAALGAIAVLTLLLDPIPPLTEHSLAASLLGGLALGCGAGLIVRTGSYTDGVNEAVFWLKRKIRLSIAELVMLINLSILAIAGLLFGWDQALYSVIAYFVAYKSLRYTMRGGHRYTVVRIRGGRREAIRSDLRRLLGPDCPFVAPDDEGTTVIVAREQEARILELVRDTDPSATVSMTPFDSVRDEVYR
ncbi:YitT family protein [Paenibacillus sp. GYB003]|uniref:YitT family protein n=1 Tax=Paenibacillus sp. GYB003 TaxID=2994392 RepID=UPI002F967A66